MAREDAGRTRDHGGMETPMTAPRRSADVRSSIIDTFRRDLVAPGPQHAGVATDRPEVEWVRAPQQRTMRLTIPDGRGDPVVVPESAAAQRKGGGLTLEAHARLFTYPTPDGEERVRALTVFLVNRRSAVHRFYADV